MAPTQASEPGEQATEERDEDSFVEVEESKDDKMRRIAKTLEAGDVVEEAHVSVGPSDAYHLLNIQNIIRIVGVDACRKSLTDEIGWRPV